MEERILRMDRKHPLGLLYSLGVAPLRIGTMGSILLMSPDINGSNFYTHCVVDEWRASRCRGLPIIGRSVVSVICLNRWPLLAQFIDLGHKYRRGIIDVISKIVWLSLNS